MVKPVTYKRRLLKLVKHLEKGKLAHSRFDFSEYHSKSVCGTLGCALGECQVLFPIEWKDSWKLPFYNNYDSPDEASVVGKAMDFFGLPRDEIEHLFTPDAQMTEFFGGVELTNDASRHEVADNIREFIKIKYHAPRK